MGSLADHIMLALPGPGSVNEKLIAFFGGGGTMQAPNSTTSALVIRGASGQTADLLQAQTSDGVTRARIGSTGIMQALYFASLDNAGAFVEMNGSTVTLYQRLAAQTALVVRGAASQSGDLLQMQNSAGSVLGRMFSYGHFTAQYFGSLTNNTNSFGVGSVINTALMSLNASNAPTVVPLVIRGSVAQTASLQEWQNSAGSALVTVTAAGVLSASVDLLVGTRAAFSGAIDTTCRSIVRTGVNTLIGLIVKGSAAQSVNLQEWQDSSGAVLARLLAGGQMYTAGAAATFGMQDSGGTIIGRTEHSFGGRVDLFKMATSAPSAPGLNDYAQMYFRPGTGAGTLKLCVRGGVSGAETVILDNITQ